MPRESRRRPVAGRDNVTDDRRTRSYASSMLAIVAFMEKRRTSMITRNVGTLDRVLRVVVGVGLLSLAFVGPATPWGYIGLIPLLTAAVGYCPLYSVLGICTDAGRKARPGT